MQMFKKKISLNGVNFEIHGKKLTIGGITEITERGLYTCFNSLGVRPFVGTLYVKVHKI